MGSLECNFTYAHYTEILELAKKEGYKILPLEDYNEDYVRVIYLRHDVDFSIESAFELAQLEHSLGIRSTFFFRLDCSYNIYSYHNYKMIKDMQAMGHEIGLHFSPGFGEEYDLKNNLICQKEIMELMLEEDVSGFSLHEPSRTKTKILQDVDGFYNAYAPNFFTKIKFISDSGGRWREGCLCEFIKKEVPQICVLIHPIWWYKKTPLERY